MTKLRWCALVPSEGIWCALVPNRKPPEDFAIDHYCAAGNTLFTLCGTNLYRPMEFTTRVPNCPKCCKKHRKR